jgi:hypothetical protein
MSRSEVEENYRLSKTSLHIPYLKLHQCQLLTFWILSVVPFFYLKQRFGDTVQLPRPFKIINRTMNYVQKSIIILIYNHHKLLDLICINVVRDY